MLPIGLSFQQAPPLSVPFRFFLTAPLFLLAAAALLFVQGPDLMTTRHSAATLAATHLLTLGFTSMIMCGALLQLLPVLGGVPLAHPARMAWLVHAPLVAGTVCLACAFMGGRPLFFWLALAFLATAFGCFGLWLMRALQKIPEGGASIQGMRAALASLAVTVAFGLLLAASRSSGLAIPYVGLSSLHPLWGLGGWTALLIVGLAYQLIPMFQLTAPYPARMTSRLMPALLLLLAGKTLGAFVPGSAGKILSVMAGLGLIAGYLWFATVTWRLLAKRRRKVPDTTLQFWRLGLGMLALSCGMALLPELVGDDLPESWLLTLGVFVLPGFILCVIQGMLYKIVPFLTWFHLQSAYPGLGIVPNVRDIHARFHAERQLALLAVALATLATSCWIPQLARVAGLLWMVYAAWLEINVLQAAHIFRKVRRVARMRTAH
ncbi:MAG: permease [Betaproteobacteria bacterium]|nr:permease [Betaproteobacteria bacterium]